MTKHTEHVRQCPGCNKGKINVSFYYCYCFTLNVCSILLHSFSVFSKVIVTFLLWLLIGWVTLIGFLKLNYPEMSSTLSQCIFLMDYWILFVNNMIKLKKRGWGLIINSLKGSCRGDIDFPFPTTTFCLLFCSERTFLSLVLKQSLNWERLHWVAWLYTQFGAARIARDVTPEIWSPRGSADAALWIAGAH